MVGWREGAVAGSGRVKEEKASLEWDASAENKS